MGGARAVGGREVVRVHTWHDNVPRIPRRSASQVPVRNGPVTTLTNDLETRIFDTTPYQAWHVHRRAW
jgi:hypothetical protein